MFEFTDSPLDSLEHLVKFVLMRLLINPIVKHIAVVSTNVTNIPTNTASILVDFSIPAGQQFYIDER